MQHVQAGVALDWSLYNGDGDMDMADKLVALMYESWADLDRAVTGLNPDEATDRHGGSSGIAWTVGHVTHMLDSWIGVRFQGLPPHPVISDANFRTARDESLAPR